jgi:hypothetical protein
LATAHNRKGRRLVTTSRRVEPTPGFEPGTFSVA